MNRPLIGSGVTLLAVSAWLAFDAFATPTIQRKWFNTYPEACGFLVAAANECSLCHTLLPNGDPTALFKHNNRYGMAIAANGYDIKATEPIDSDLDGRTNGQEIKHDCTLPADPRSVVPVSSTTWSVLKARFR
jgi:hypothetical protein